jgi:hypothetical protein
MSSKFREDFDTSRFTKFLFDMRIQEELPEWPPLHVQKRKSRRTRIILLLCLLIIVLLFLIANVIFLNIRVLSVQPATPSSTSLSVNAQQCLSQYTLNAPSSPSSYPCSTCLPILQAVPLSSNSQNAQQIINAIQFCGLRAIFDTANSQGQASLSWVNDVKFCAWNGVTCDSSGRVANLSAHSTKFRVPPLTHTQTIDVPWSTIIITQRTRCAHRPQVFASHRWQQHTRYVLTFYH